MDQGRCSFHPEREAIGNCNQCGKPICSLCSIAIEGKSYCPGCAEKVGFGVEEVGKQVPWENRKEIGFWPALWQTWKNVIFHPKDFFSKMPTRRGLGGPLFFGVIFGTIQLVISCIFDLLTKTGPQAEQLPAGAMGIGAGVIIVLSPLLAIVGIFIASAFWHLIVFIFGGREGFEATFRVMCYSSAVYIFTIVPILGAIFAGIYGLILYFFGFREAHKLTTGRTLVAVFLLPVIAAVGLLAAIAIPNLMRAREEALKRGTYQHYEPMDRR